MSAASLVDQFQRNGFVKIPNVFPKIDIESYRIEVEKMFQDFKNPNVISQPFENNTNLAEILLNPKLLRAVKEILGDEFFLFPEVSLMKDQFGGWHKDTTSIELFGHDFHKSNNFSVVNVAIYFQDNGVYGGGLDVVPASQFVEDEYVEKMRAAFLDAAKPSNSFKGSLSALLNPHIKNFIKKRLLKSRLTLTNAAVPLAADDPRQDGHKILSLAGDAVVFDIRLYHKASWPERLPDTGELKNKFALFAICGAKNDCSLRYREYLNNRAQKESAYKYLINYTPKYEVTNRLRNHGVICI